MTTLWRVAPQKRYPKTKHCLARGRICQVATWNGPGSLARLSPMKDKRACKILRMII